MDGENGSSQAFKTLVSYGDLHPAVMPSAGVDGENGSYQALTMEAYDGDLHLRLAPPTSPHSSAPLDSSAAVHASSSLQAQEERGGVDGALENGHFSGVVPVAPKPPSSKFSAVMTPYDDFPLYPPLCPVAQSVVGGTPVSTAPPIPGIARINQPPILVPALQTPDGNVFMLVQPPYTTVQAIGGGTPISPAIPPPIWGPPVQTPYGVYLAVQSTGGGTPVAPASSIPADAPTNLPPPPLAPQQREGRTTGSLNHRGRRRSPASPRSPHRRL
uniref:Uncharacterized protein n=1 Tax=Kalanchoe fedtschenkoi TaxID=63787 RepID=A0A7N0ULR8_KALFE